MSDKLIAGIAACRRRRGETEWLLTAPQKKDTWELPKDTVRRGESSVSAAIRFLAEFLGIRGRIIEEAGRASTAPDKFIFYLMYLTGIRNGESLPKTLSLENKWFSYAQATKKLSLARERRILKQAKNVFREWQKEKGD